jgi:hypothetical protein
MRPCRNHPHVEALPRRRLCQACRTAQINGRAFPVNVDRPAEPAINETIHPARPVAWHTDLTELRRALPPGTCVGLGPRGVAIDLIGERHVFATYEAALEFATDPTRTWPAEPPRGLDVAPAHVGTRR